MFADHPSTEDFEKFLRSSSRSIYRAANAQVMRHLLSDCTACRDRLNAMGWSQARLANLLHPVADSSRPGEGFSTPSPAEAETHDYSRAFAAVERRVSAFLAPESHPMEKSVDLLLAELADLPASEQIERISGGGPYSTPPVIRGLIDRSHALRYRNADEMLHLADLARLAVECCPASAADGELKLADLRTRVWGAYGNALRVGSRPQEAEEAFATARDCRKQGTGDPVLRAWLSEKITPLAIFQGRFEEAIEMCEEAGQIYQELGESHHLASTLTQKAIASLYSGESERAIRALNQAIPLVDYEEDPHLLLAACHNLIRCYIDLDRPDQALAIYSETRVLYQEFDDPLILLRAAWQEGQLLRDLGHLRAAETALLRARKGYQEQRLAYEMALVSLDLATVYVKLGLGEEVKRTVMTTVPIFHALRVKLETLAALLQLQQVADQEQQALELIRTLNARVEPLRKGALGSPLTNA
jgi:tetratricopeptide (TPR) repeat protein